MIEMLKMLIPHFSTKDIAAYSVDKEGTQFVLGFSMEDFDPDEDEEPTHVIELQVFLFLGYGWSPKLKGGPWTYKEWLDANSE